MRSVRKALRAGEIEKGTYDRLECAECGATLKSRNDPDELGVIRSCHNCDREWQEIK